MKVHAFFFRWCSGRITLRLPELLHLGLTLNLPPEHLTTTTRLYPSPYPCNPPSLCVPQTMKMTFGDWETFRAAVETLRQREAAGGASAAAADTAEARKIRFQLTTDSGKVTQANSVTSSAVTSEY